jgi:defect in organelle trafficking protein DotB
MSDETESNGEFDHPFMFPNEPVKFTEQELNRLLIHLSKTGCSDIKIQTNSQVVGKIQGKVLKVTRRPLPPPEVEQMLSVIYGTNGPSIIKDGRDIDKGYELNPSRGERYRYRVNAVGGTTKGQKGIDITIRTIVIEPPTMDSLKVEDGIRKGVFPKDGIVIVVGPTGSGKSTLISSFIRTAMEQEDAHKFIVTFEAPIEYVYDTVKRPSCVVWQSEIGLSGDLRSFADGIRNAMRRAPDIIFTGETRDIETAEASIAAAQSGHAVYTTVHANSATDAFSRIVNMFPTDARSGIMNSLVSSVRMVIWQRLFRRPDGKGRVAVREFLNFDDDTRAELLSIGADNMNQMLIHMRKLVSSRGMSMGQSARIFFDQGMLSEADLIAISSAES